LFFYGSYSPRNQQRTNNYNFSGNTNGDIPRDTWNQQAFGKASFASRRCQRQLFDSVDADHGHGHAERLQRRDAQLADLVAGGAGAEHHPRLGAEPGQHQRHGATSRSPTRRF
jgi:hypothetical protein